MDWCRTELGSAARAGDLVLLVIPDDEVSWRWSVNRRSPGKLPEVLVSGVSPREEEARRLAELAVGELCE